MIEVRSVVKIVCLFLLLVEVNWILSLLELIPNNYNISWLISKCIFNKIHESLMPTPDIQYAPNSLIWTKNLTQFALVALTYPLSLLCLSPGRQMQTYVSLISMSFCWVTPLGIQKMIFMFPYTVFVYAWCYFARFSFIVLLLSLLFQRRINSLRLNLRFFKSVHLFCMILSIICVVFVLNCICIYLLFGWREGYKFGICVVLMVGYYGVLLKDLEVLSAAIIINGMPQISKSRKVIIKEIFTFIFFDTSERNVQTTTSWYDYYLNIFRIFMIAGSILHTNCYVLIPQINIWGETMNDTGSITTNTLYMRGH